MADQKNLRVLHTQVGSWPKGFVLATSDLPEGADRQRLLGLGAVEEVEDKRTGDEPLGPELIAKQQKAKAKADSDAEKAARATKLASPAKQ